MSTIIKLEPVARRSVTGDSNGPQGADGTAVLAREAYMAMLASEWEADEDPATMPVHDFRRAKPSGQAFKAVWGYVDTARSQLSCCGAECYTYRIPVDALDSTNQDGVANVESVSVRLAGDRYLDMGVCLWCELSSSPTPSPLSVAIASGDGVGRLAAQNQTEADGSPIAPNKRSGAEETVEVDMGSAAPADYIHIHLYLADYLGVRGGWIEGGAMFADEAAEVAFSRDVEPNDAEAGACALNIGRVTFETGEGAAMTPAYALARIPRLSLWQNFRIAAYPDVFAALTGDSYALRIANLLAHVVSSPALWATSGLPASAASLSYGQTGLLAVSRSSRVGSAFEGSDSVGFCCLCAHGLTRARVFRGLRFETAIPADIPFRLLVYGVDADLAISSTAPGSTLRFATPLAYWADVLSRTFREGGAYALRVLTDSSLSASSMPAAGDTDTVAVPVQPLAACSVTAPLARVAFDRPFRSGELSSVIVALIPEGAPASEETAETTIQGTATRDVVATIPVSTTRQPLTTGVSPTGRIIFKVQSSVRSDISNAIRGAGVIDGASGIVWNSNVMEMGPFINKNDCATAKMAILDVSFNYGGKTYTYYTSSFDEQIGDPAINVSWKASIFLWRPDSNSSAITYAYGLSSDEKSFSFVAHAPDGSTLPVTATLKPGSISLIGTGGCDAYYNFGELYPSEWSVASANYARNVSTTSYDGLVQSSRVTLPGYVYSFSKSENENAVATVTQSGVITLARDGVTYTAPYSYTRSPTLRVTSKTSSRIIVGNDTTQTATILGAIHGLNTRLQFTGSDGSTMWAQAVLPQGSCEGNIPFQARSAYNGSAQGIGTVNNDGTGAYGGDGLVATITIRESYASVPVDPGLITLYE